MMFALLLVPIMGLVGAGLDYARFINRTAQLQAAVDAAALEGAKVLAVSTFAASQTAATKMFNTNAVLDSYTTLGGLSISQSGNNLVITATGTIQTTISSMLGVSSVPFTVTAQASYAQPWMEIVIVQDITGSMNDAGKIAAAKTAAVTMINTLFADPMIGPKLSMGVIPFNTQVNIGTGYAGSWWLRTDSTGINTSDGATTNYGLTQMSCWWWCTTTTYPWAGCLIDRDTAYDQNNSLPVSGVSASYYRAAYCEYATPQTLPLTTDSSSLVTMVNGLTANGGTSIPIALQTAFAMLTPGVPFNVSQSNTRTTKQIIVLLTDGVNSDTANASVAGVDGRYGSTTPSPDDRMMALCTNIKNAGIVLYTVDIIDGDVNRLRSCATNTSYFFQVTSSSGIGPALATITAGIQSLRLTQ